MGGKKLLLSISVLTSPLFPELLTPLTVPVYMKVENNFGTFWLSFADRVQCLHSTGLIQSVTPSRCWQLVKHYPWGESLLQGMGPGVTGHLAAGRVMESRYTAPDDVAVFLAQDTDSNFCHEL